MVVYKCRGSQPIPPLLDSGVSGNNYYEQFYKTPIALRMICSFCVIHEGVDDHAPPSLFILTCLNEVTSISRASPFFNVAQIRLCMSLSFLLSAFPVIDRLFLARVDWLQI